MTGMVDLLTNKPSRKVREVTIKGRPVAVSETPIGFLGRILWYSVWSLEIKHGDFIDLLRTSGIPEGLWPNETRAIDAFKKACKSVENKDYVVVKDAVEVNGVKKTIPNSMVVARRIREERSLPVVLRVIFENGSLVFRDMSGKDAEELHRQISKAYAFYKEHLVADDIRVFLNQAIKTMHPIQLKSSGGVYFVTEQHAPLVEGLSTVMESFRTSSPGTEFITLPVVDRQPERSTILWKYEVETTRRLRELTEKLISMVKGGAELYPSHFKKYQQEYEWLLAQKREYEELLETAMVTVDTELDLLKKALLRLSENVISKEG